MCNLEQLCEDVQEFLDLDPVHWSSDEGYFPYDGTDVFYRKLPDHFVLEVNGMEVTIPRL